jgi:hypothetical protein
VNSSNAQLPKIPARQLGSCAGPELPSHFNHHPSSIDHHPSTIIHPPSSILHPPLTLLPLALLAAVLLLPAAARSQEALQNMRALDTARAQRREQMASENYTFKRGDFRLLATPSLGLDWNDNIRSSDLNQEADFILRPMLQLGATYPLTQVNLLTLTLGVGYDHYFSNDELSGLRVQSGSALSFDIFVKDFTINLHDRLSYTRDSSQEAAVANTADFGNFQNTAGLSVSWLLRKATLTAGYDHVNVVSIESTFNSQDRATEMFSSRASFEVHPQVQAGLEGTASFTTYDQATLNDNANYSAGLFATWQPGVALRVSPRAGYTFTQFEQSSTSIRTEDLSSYYYDLTVAHDITDAFSYGLSVGHDVRLGIASDVIETTYFRPNVTWRAFERTALRFGFFYEQGEQGVGNQSGGLMEKYDWYGANVGASWNLTKNITVGANYRLTIRSSDQAAREYTQNLIGLMLTYYPR